MHHGNRQPVILAVTADPEVVISIQEAYEGKARLVILSDANAALAVLGSRPVDMAIVDSALPGRMALVLARAFLWHQPAGRVALIGAADDPTTLIGLAFRDARVELLYRPVEAETLRHEMALAGASA